MGCRLRRFVWLAVTLACAAAFAADEDAGYVRKATWQETLHASYAQIASGSSGGVKLGPWAVVGPFNKPGQDSVFGVAFPPEADDGDRAATFDEGRLKWTAHPEWKDGEVTPLLPRTEHAAFYLSRTMTVAEPIRITAYLGSDDGLTVWLNGRKALDKDVYHACAPDQERVELDLHAGENRLLLKISNGILDAGFYFSLRPGGNENSAAALDPMWDRLRRDFPDSVRPIDWLRSGAIYGSQPQRCDYGDPRVRFDGKWQYTAANGAPTYGLQSDEAGAKFGLDFVGTSVDLLHRAGNLGQWGVIYEDTGRPFGLAGVEIDGKPAPALRDAVQMGPDGLSVIDTSRNDGRTPLARNLPPGRHRLTLTNLGRPNSPGGSTTVVVVGFLCDIADGNEWSRLAWRCAAAVREGEGWRQQAEALASATRTEAEFTRVENLYLAWRELHDVTNRIRALRAEQPDSPMVERERRVWVPKPETKAYLERLGALKKRVDAELAKVDAFRFDFAPSEVPASVSSSSLPATRSSSAFTALLAEVKGAAADVDAFFRNEVRSLSPIAFFTGAPLQSGAVPNYVWQSEPLGGTWGCSIRTWDPAHPEQPAKTVFQEPNSAIFDLNLSYDAKTLFFSMRRNRAQCWQIFEIGIDGANLKQITTGPHFNVCPVPLPDGRLAFISSRTPGYHTVCQSGPCTHVYVMDRDGSNARDLSTNTLSDFGLGILDDGRLLFTRWEYVDVTLTYRQSLWTQYPDGHQFQLYFGNTILDPSTFWQAREIPGRDAVVCTFTGHHHSPHGAIGMIKSRFGVEAPRDVGFRWITREFPSVLDMNLFWSYRDPYPVGENRFLVSYGGGGANRFRLFLLDDMDNKELVYDDPATSCFYPLPLVPRPAPAAVPDTLPKGPVATIEVPAAPPGQPKAEKVPLGRFMVMDVNRGLEPIVARGRAKSIRIMEQLPKTVDRTWNTVMDQGPLMGASSYYAKRVWGYAPVESDGSAYFEAPAMKEIYFQVCDEEGRELQRMTSAVQLMPGETQSCVGCHESRDTSPPPSTARVLAMQRPPTKLELPAWGQAGVMDYNKVVQPVLDKHCVSCHQGTNPDGGVTLTGSYTRFFNMSYDNLVTRSRSEEVSRALYGKRNTERPMVQSLHLLYGIMVPFRPLSSGSLVSRLPEYFQASHSKKDVSLADRRIIYEWIDAMIPYYPTTDYARLEGRSNRDKWGDRDRKDLLPWFNEGFAPVYNRRCASCHGQANKDIGLADPRQWSWVDLTKPEWSPALTAHLSKEAKGRGIPAKDFQFKDTNDPDYQAMLMAITEGGKKAYETPEADMPGFVSRSGDRAFRYR